MVRYFIEVSNGIEFFDCHGPLFGSQTEALIWAFHTFPAHDFRASPRLLAS